MVGVSLALMLAHELPSHVRITLVEGFVLPSGLSSGLRCSFYSSELQFACDL